MKLTSTSRGSWLLGVLLLAALPGLGCSANDTFPCGANACKLGSEVCLLDANEGPDGCGRCAPRPAACDPEITCGCVPKANDASWELDQCDDEGSCTEEGGGVVVRCKAPNWGCG
jgi:hypothetical protein